MPDIYENEQKQDVEISGPSQGETVLYPHVIGQSARESFTEYANPRLEELAVSPDENIQDALKGLEARGGGILRLRSGTYRVNYPITVPSNVKIIGENESTTIIDFLNTAANITFEGTNIYTTGTISSIGSGGTVVTGSSTAWLANVTTNHQLFIDEWWYRIAAITGDTTIILAEPYKEAATFSGTYRAVILKTDIYIENVTLTNSTGTAIVGTDIRRIFLHNVTMLTCNKGFVFTNFSFLLLTVVTSVDSTSNGYELTNGVFFNASLTMAIGGDAHGVVVNNIRNCVWNLCATTGNADDGLNATDMTISLVVLETSGNTGQGIEFVSGCNLNRIEATNANANTSDGIKFTATSDNNIISGAIVRSNGGYGINIAAASCDNNVILTPVFGANTSGDINDAGTGTITIQTSSVAGDSPLFGDGSDGAVTISVNTTLSSDMYYSSLTVNSGVTLNTGGYRVFVSGTLTNNGTISRVGNVGTAGNAGETTTFGTGGAGGAALAGGTIPGSLAGVAGGNGSNSGVGVVGSNGSNEANGVGSAGAAGGAGGGTGGDLGGAAGTGGTVTTSASKPRDYIIGTTLTIIAGTTRINKNGGGSGGGGGGEAGGADDGGGGSGGGGGGGSGSNGGTIVICARTLTNSGTITVAGGAGGNGGDGGDASGVNRDGSGGGGGGAGGSGGLMVIIYNALTAGTITVAGGAGGTGGLKGDKDGTGADGVAGSNGSTGTSGESIQLQF